MVFNPSLIDAPIPVSGVEGYHVNIAPSVYTDDLAPYLMTPTQPRRVFAGAATIFLKFADEEEARAMLADYWMEPEDAS
jgi:hypothetical protein